jgi:hypothetical protein
MNIFEACEAGDMARLCELINQDPSLVHARTSAEDKERGGGNTLLHRASWFNRTEAVGLLLDRGADIEAKDGDHGGTPLCYCAWRANIEAAELLLDRGADINATNKYGETPLKVAQIGASGGLKQHHFAKPADNYRPLVDLLDRRREKPH